MGHYLFQLAYTSEAWQTLISKPQNLAEMVRPAIQKMDGDISASWVCFDDYDLVAIVQLPDDVTAAAAMMAFKAGGAVREAKHTRLFSWEETMEAMGKAREAG